MACGSQSGLAKWWGLRAKGNGEQKRCLNWRWLLHPGRAPVVFPSLILASVLHPLSVVSERLLCGVAEKSPSSGRAQLICSYLFGGMQLEKALIKKKPYCCLLMKLFSSCKSWAFLQKKKKRPLVRRAWAVEMMVFIQDEPENTFLGIEAGKEMQSGN